MSGLAGQSPDYWGTNIVTGAGAIENDARSKIADRRRYYNESRPHSALQWAIPAEFVRQAKDGASTDRRFNSAGNHHFWSGRY